MIPAFLRDAIAIWRFVRDVDRAIAPIQAGMRDAAEAARRDPRRPAFERITRRYPISWDGAKGLAKALDPRDEMSPAEVEIALARRIEENLRCGIEVDAPPRPVRAPRTDPVCCDLSDPTWRERQTITPDAYQQLPLDVRKHYVPWRSAAGAPPHGIVGWVHLGVDRPRAESKRETMRVAVDGDGIARSFVGVVERRADGGVVVHSVTEPLREDPPKPEICVGDYVRHAWNPNGPQAWMCVEEAPGDNGHMRADGWWMHRDAIADHRARPEIRSGDYVHRTDIGWCLVAGPGRSVGTIPEGWVPVVAVSLAHQSVTGIDARSVEEHRPCPRITLPGGREVAVDRMWRHERFERGRTRVSIWANAAGAGWFGDGCHAWQEHYHDVPYEEGTGGHCVPAEYRVWPPIDVEPAKPKPRRVGIWQRLPTFNVGDTAIVSGVWFRIVEADGDMRRLEPVPPR